jgi:hypothetical protein
MSQSGILSTATAISNVLTSSAGSITITPSGSSVNIDVANYATALWTPNLQIGGSSTGITYTTQSGGYTQSENVVNFWCHILLSSKGAGSGNVTISNLPVSTGINGSHQCICISGYNQFTVAGYQVLGLQLSTSSTVGTIMASGEASTFLPISATQISNTFQIIFNGSYITD